MNSPDKQGPRPTPRGVRPAHLHNAIAQVVDAYGVALAEQDAELQLRAAELSVLQQHLREVEANARLYKANWQHELDVRAAREHNVAQAAARVYGEELARDDLARGAVATALQRAGARILRTFPPDDTRVSSAQGEAPCASSPPA